MDATITALAIYAAIISTGALALEIRRWFESGPRLSLLMIPVAQTRGGISDENRYLHITVSNRGAMPTTLTNFCLFQYKTIFHRWMQRPERAAVVPNTERLGGNPLPYVIVPGTDWHGATTYDQGLKDWALTGRLFVGVVSSHHHRARLKKVRVDLKMFNAG